MKAYLRNHKRNYEPVVNAILRNPINGKHVSIDLTVDTGFQGGILIPLKTYVELNLNLLEKPKVIGTTAVGTELELRKALITVEINNLKINCHAYTALGITKALLGREALMKLGMIYKPPNELKIGIK